MPIDPNVFDKIKTFEDYRKADQAFQLQKSLQQQQIETGGLDQQAKKLSLVGQIVGNNSIDQESYDRSRQTAASQGLDISALPDQYNPNIVNRLRFAGATPTAQLSAMLQQNQMALRAGTATGDVGAYGYGSGLAGLPATSSNSSPQQPPIPTAAKPNPITQVQAGTPEGNQAVNDLFGDQPSQPVILSGSPNIAPAAVPKVSFRGQKSGETIDAYKASQQQAWEQFKLNNAGPLKKIEASSNKIGEHIGEASKTLNIMQSNLPTVLERFQNMRNAASDASYGYGVNEEGSGFKQAFNNQFDTGTGKANQKLKQYAAQGILPELGPQLAQAGIRGNKFLETLASSASGLDLAASPEAKQELINGLENTYIHNLKATAEQLRTNGQSASTDAEIDAAVSKIKGAKPTQIPKSSVISYQEYFK